MVLTRAQSRHNVHGDAALSDNEGEGGIGNANGSGAGTTPVKQAKVEEQQQQHGNGKNKSKDAIIQPSTGTYEASPRTTSYEFLGPPGAFLISTLVPYFSYFFAYACDERGCPSTPFVPYMQQGWAHIQTAHFWKELLLDRRGYEIYFGWYAFTVLCWAVLPGKWIDGGALRNGQRLTYKINGEGRDCRCPIRQPSDPDVSLFLLRWLTDFGSSIQPYTRSLRLWLPPHQSLPCMERHPSWPCLITGSGS